MSRINLSLIKSNANVDIDQLYILFHDRGVEYLSNYIRRAVTHYDALTCVDNADTVWYKLLDDKIMCITALCVYLAIVDIAQVYKADLSITIAQDLWVEDCDIFALWDRNPYILGIHMYSRGHGDIWDKMKEYHRETGAQYYLGFASLLSIAIDLESVSEDCDLSYNKLAHNLIDSKIFKDGIAYEFKW